MAAIKKPIERVRKRIASFRCSNAEYQQLEDAASRADVPLSDWLRDTTLAIAGGERWPTPGTVLKVGDDLEQARVMGAGEIISVDVQCRTAAPEPPPAFEPEELAEGWVEVPVTTIVAPPENLVPDILKAYMKPAVARITERIEDKLFSLHEQFAKDHPLSVELPLTWADHWALMERMEPGEATERLFELAAGRKFDPDFPRWPKARKIEWLEATWPL